MGNEVKAINLVRIIWIDFIVQVLLFLGLCVLFYPLVLCCSSFIVEIIVLAALARGCWERFRDDRSTGMAQLNVFLNPAGWASWFLGHIHIFRFLAEGFLGDHDCKLCPLNPFQLSLSASTARRFEALCPLRQIPALASLRTRNLSVVQDNIAVKITITRCASCPRHGWLNIVHYLY